MMSPAASAIPPTSGVEVVDASQAAPMPQQLLGRRLDHPVSGGRIDSRSCLVAGWVLPKIGRAMAVELVHEGHLIARAGVGLRRPDLSRAFPRHPGAESAGFRTTVNLLAVNRDLNIEVRAVIPGGTRVAIGNFLVQRSRDSVAMGPWAHLVSVVIPCFNQAHYLAEAIESVLGQTHPEFEIVVVDDGSTDNTWEVAARYPGVQCVTKSHSGVASARNEGLGASQGAFVVFLDADDRLLPRALEVGLQALDKRPEAAFVAGACRDIGADGHPLPTEQPPLVEDDHYAKLLEESFIWSGSAIVYRRRALEAVGGFNERRVAADDYELYLTIARRFPVFCHPELVTEYRRHGSNQTRDPGFTLSSEIRVLRAQRRGVRGKHERSARRAGIRRTKEEHGEALAIELRSSVAWRDWGQAWRRGLLLARWYPKGILSLARSHRRGL
jgi:glycosyltransferase involved in cell wall biosynthesis